MSMKNLMCYEIAAGTLEGFSSCLMARNQITISLICTYRSPRVILGGRSLRETESVFWIVISIYVEFNHHFIHTFLLHARETFEKASKKLGLLSPLRVKKLCR